MAELTERSHPRLFRRFVIGNELVLHCFCNKLPQGNAALSCDGFGAAKDGIGDFEGCLHLGRGSHIYGSSSIGRLTCVRAANLRYLAKRGCGSVRGGESNGPRRSSRASARKSGRPRLCLIVSSRRLAALNRSSFSGFPIRARAVLVSCQGLVNLGFRPLASGTYDSGRERPCRPKCGRKAKTA